MNPPSIQCDELDQALCSKIEKWWNKFLDPRSTSPLVTKGMLFTNEHALPSATYAQRRALRNDHDAFRFWKDHLDQQGITSVSPGLLFLRILPKYDVPRTSSLLEYQYTLSQGKREPMVVHRFVPKTMNGSIWTPHNFNAIESTRRDSLYLFQT
jgi:hypothetical protein